MQSFLRILNWFVPKKIQDDYRQSLNAQLVAGNGIIWGIVAGTTIGTVLLLLGHTLGFYLVLSSGCVIILTPFIMKYTFQVKLAGHIIVLALVAALLLWAFYQGGLYAYINIWLSVLIVLSVLVINIKAGIFYTTIVVSAYILFFIFNNDLPKPFTMHPEKERVVMLFISSGSAIVVFGLTAVFALIQKNTLSKLKKTQFQLLHSEKMASIGQLAAGVAHEINNPMGYIISNVNMLHGYYNSLNHIIFAYEELLKKEHTNIDEVYEKIETLKKENDLEYIINDFTGLIKDTLDGANNVKHIVENLNEFSHPTKDKLLKLDINEEIEKSLAIVYNELKYHCKIEKIFGVIPEVFGNKTQFEQIIINLLMNASHATKETQGIIKIKTYKRRPHVFIEIIDNGKGIPEKVLGKIFDPFFTTKDVGQGIGLGLSIVYGIVKNHNWQIDVKSQE